MYRDLRKYIAEYTQYLEANRPTTRGAFYLDDLRQIIEIGGDPAIIIHNAMAAGFIIGYKTAKKEIRQKAACHL